MNSGFNFSGGMRPGKTARNMPNCGIILPKITSVAIPQDKTFDNRPGMDKFLIMFAVSSLVTLVWILFSGSAS